MKGRGLLTEAGAEGEEGQHCPLRREHLPPLDKKGGVCLLLKAAEITRIVIHLLGVGEAGLVKFSRFIVRSRLGNTDR